jgi:two-component system sensor histidine kinase BaeS
MIRLGIRQKLLLIFTSIVLVGGLALFASAGAQLSGAVVEFYQRDLLAEALQVSSGLSENMEHYLSGEGNAQALQTILDRSRGANPDAAFTILDRERRVVASTSSPRYPILTQVPATWEVRAALEGQSAYTSREDDQGQMMAYAVAPITYEGRSRGVVLASAPLAPAYAEANQNWTSLAQMAIPILLATIAASLWFGQSIARPIQHLNRAARHIAEGDFTERADVRAGDEIGQLADTFNDMAERIETLLQAQRSFVSNAAHELRTPLASLKVRIEALQAGHLSPQEQQDYLAEVAAEVNQMAMLITQLLTLARLDESRHPAGAPLEDVAAFFQDGQRRWHILAQEAGLTFSAELPAEISSPAIAAGDLQMVLDNLVGNALKYTPAGGTVRLRVKPEDGRLRVAVSDTGEGFTPEDAEHLFDRFFRADRSRSRQVYGTGLGLSIVRTIVAHYGGTITAHSDGLGQGATFEVVLPLAVEPLSN